jgi:hypothetical protein
MNLIKFTRPLIAFLALILLSLACAISAGPPAIGEVVVAKSLAADYTPVDPTSVYTSDDTVINISVEVQNVVVGSVVTVKYKLNGEDYEMLTTTADKEGSGYYGFTLTFDSGILPGDYVADVYLNDQLAKSVTFKAEPSGPPSIGSVVATRSVDDSFKATDPTSTFSPNDTFHLSVQVKNLLVGSNITVKYYIDGVHAEEADTTVIADKAGSGYYDFSLTPPADGFPVSEYTAEVYLDNTLSNTITFLVK